MKSKIIFMLCFCISTLTIAQTNILNTIGDNNILTYSKIIENNNSYYFIQKIISNASNKKWAFELFKIDKFSFQIINQKHLSGDTTTIISANDSFDVTILLIIDNNKIHLLFNRNYTDTPFGHKQLIYSQLDTNFNTLIPEKEIYTTLSDTINDGVNPENYIKIDNRLYFIFLTGQFVNSNQIQRTEILQTDLNGNVIRLDSLKRVGYYPFQVLIDLYKNPDNTYLLSGQSINPYGVDGLMLTDSNFHELDSFPLNYFVYNGSTHIELTRYLNTVKLPTSSIIAGGSNQDNNGNNVALLMKLNPNNRYTPTIKFLTPKDAQDHAQSTDGLYLLAYNEYDHLVYYTTATHKQTYSSCGLNYNYLQIIAVDTNLNIIFKKYLYSGVGGCYAAQYTESAFNRTGVTIYTSTKLLTNPNDKGGRAYFIDSTTPTAINGPNELSIRNRLEILPNPASSFFQISDIFNQAGIYSVINLMGQTVRSGSYDAINNKIEVTDLPTGNYLIHLQTKDGEMQNVKMLKE